MKGLGTPKTQSTGNRQAVIIRHLKEALTKITVLYNDMSKTDNEVLKEMNDIAIAALEAGNTPSSGQVSNLS